MAFSDPMPGDREARRRAAKQLGEEHRGNAADQGQLIGSIIGGLLSTAAGAGPMPGMAIGGKMGGGAAKMGAGEMPTAEAGEVVAGMTSAFRKKDDDDEDEED